MSRHPRTPTMRGAQRQAGRADSDPVRSLLAARAAARVVDAALVVVPVLVVSTLLGLTGGVALVVIAMLTAYFYEAVSVATYGATAGKMWRGLEVVSAADGGRVPLSRAGTRILFVLVAAGIVHMIAPVGPAAAVFLWGSAAVAPDGRGLPDSVAGTTVRRRA